MRSLLSEESKSIFLFSLKREDLRCHCQLYHGSVTREKPACLKFKNYYFKIIRKSGKRRKRGIFLVGFCLFLYFKKILKSRPLYLLLVILIPGGPHSFSKLFFFGFHISAFSKLCSDSVTPNSCVVMSED